MDTNVLLQLQLQDQTFTQKIQAMAMHGQQITICVERVITVTKLNLQLRIIVLKESICHGMEQLHYQIVCLAQVDICAKLQVKFHKLVQLHLQFVQLDLIALQDLKELVAQ